LDASYWHNKWDTNDIKFHQAEYNPLMVQHFSKLDLPVGAAVFVPLCGKTHDIAWLLEQGFRVIGAELNETAVKDLFANLNLQPVVTQDGAFKRYTTTQLVVFTGDIFELTKLQLGEVAAVFDRAALVALPAEMRARYVTHVMQITEHAPQFLLTYNYDQSTMNGPPFAISPEMVADYFDTDFTVTLIETIDLGALKGKIPAEEAAWVLRHE